MLLEVSKEIDKHVSFVAVGWFLNKNPNNMKWYYLYV